MGDAYDCDIELAIASQCDVELAFASRCDVELMIADRCSVELTIAFCCHGKWSIANDCNIELMIAYIYGGTHMLTVVLMSLLVGRDGTQVITEAAMWIRWPPCGYRGSHVVVAMW